MSEQTSERRCQWERCEAEATTHAQYDYKSLGEIAQDDHSSTLGFLIMHADLCPAHLEELKAGRHGARAIGRGMCSSNCPMGW